MAPPVPASSSAGKTSCTDLTPVDLKSFQQLPKRSELKAEDQASEPLRVFYEKMNAYLLIDSKDSGIGNGNDLLEPSEVDQFFAKYKSRDPRVNTCSLMTEAREFSKAAPQLAKAFREGQPLSKELVSSKETPENDFPFFQIGLGVLVFAYVIRKVVQRFRQGPPPGGTGGSGGTRESSTQKMAKVIPLKKNGVQKSVGADQSMVHSATVYLGDNGNLSSQIQRMYGGTNFAEVSNPKAPVPTALPVTPLVPNVIPLMAPVPLTLPTFQAVPALRPIPLPVAR
jgi:hypothetical protein